MLSSTSSTRSFLLASLVLSLAASVTYAVWWDNQTNNDTDTRSALDATTGLLRTDNFVPFPGGAWLLKMASSETTFVDETNGVTYTSAYDAMLQGDPANNPVRNFNAWVNSWMFSSQFAAWVCRSFCNNNFEWGHYLLCYMRNFVGACLVYYGTAAFFHYHCYIHPRAQEIFKDRPRPSTAIILDQIKLAQAALFIYVGLPVVDEYLVENGYTKVYYSLDEVGGFGYYALYMVLYFSMVEIGIYWMHRTLHTNKFLYKHVHGRHHAYNKPETLTPWASIAFNPIDGMLQAAPYVLCLPIVPVHYLTHFGLLFFTAIWATYIHDSMDLNIDPIMGSKYHTVHHTHYIYNYGQVFTFCDRFWGTLRVPEGKTGTKRQRLKRL